MYIAYLWVDSWLKLMSACVEQMQPEMVASGRTGLNAGEIERLRAEHDGVLQALLAAHANELGELEQRMTTHRDALVELRAAHTNELQQLRSKAGDATAVAAEWARRYEQLRTEAERLRREAATASEEQEQRRAAAARTQQEKAASARAAFEATIAGLQGELSDAQEGLRTARQEAAAASAVLDDIRTQNATLRADVAKAVAAASAEGDRTRAKVAELSAALQRETAAASAARQENQRLAAELAARTGESKRLAAQLAEAQLPPNAGSPAGRETAAAPLDPAPKPAKRTRRSAAPVAAGTAAALASSDAAGDTLVAERPVEQASAAPPALTVGFRKPEGWAEPLYVYYWATHPAVAEPGWPGMAMSDAGDGWWTCRIEGAAAADLLFNDHRGNQTGDLRRDRCGRLDRDGRWIDDDPS